MLFDNYRVNDNKEEYKMATDEIWRRDVVGHYNSAYTISRLIAALEEFAADHGDLPVHGTSYFDDDHPPVTGMTIADIEFAGSEHRTVLRLR